MPAAEDKRLDVAKAIEPSLKDPDSWTRIDAAKALAVWGGKENTPALIAALKDPDVFTRGEALNAIKAIHDPAAAEAVAEFLEKLGERGKAADILRAMGDPAEPAVLKYLDHPDVFVRAEACKVLQAIGTPTSVPALYEVVRRSNGSGFDGMAARAAVQRIDPTGKGYREFMKRMRSRR
jgi:HEAT repeat protein